VVMELHKYEYKQFNIRKSTKSEIFEEENCASKLHFGLLLRVTLQFNKVNFWQKYFYFSDTLIFTFIRF
jgi:hypothetical protein